MKRLISFVFILVACVALSAQTQSDKPLLTIGCLSDVHCMNSMITPASGSIGDIWVRSSMEKVLNRMKTEDNVDVIVLGGDCQSDKTIDEANAMMTRWRIAELTRGFFPEGKNPNVLWVTGNHDWEVANFDAIPKPYLAGDFYRFPMKEDLGILPDGDAFYEQADNGVLGKETLLAAYHYVLNGFDFVVLNCGKNFFKSAWDYTYSAESAQWVADKLNDIYADDPNKTVFFCLHVPFPDSNSLNAGKGMKDDGAKGAYQILKKAFCEHPNLIMLYGHDHGKDGAYTREKTSQRVTLYNKSGQVISSTDATHFDGEIQQGTNNTSDDNFVGKFTLLNANTAKYLNIDTYNLAIGTTALQYTVSATAGKFTFNTTDVSGKAVSLHIGKNGRWSSGEASEIFVFDTEGHRVKAMERGKEYYLVGLNSEKYYALRAEIYSAGSDGQRMEGTEVSLSSDLSSITSVPGASCLWTANGEEPDALKGIYFKSKSGKYFGIANGNVAVLDEGYAFWLQAIDGQLNAFKLSDANSTYWINSGSSGYLSPAAINETNNIRNYYFYEATTTAAGVTGTLVKKPEVGKDYVIVVKNENSGSAGLYAVYCSMANTTKVRFDVVKLSSNNASIPSTVSLTTANTSSYGPIDLTKVVWTIEKGNTSNPGPDPETKPTGDASFFSAFMGSLRYYYNTIDTGDPADCPTVVQALLVYVYPDRVVLEMKNYNQTGLLKGIQINEKLATYTSVRPVTNSTPVTYVKGDPTEKPKEPEPDPAPEFPLEDHPYAIKNVDAKLYLNVRSHDSECVTLGSTPQPLYFKWKNKGFHIVTEDGLYVGGHSNTWNMSSKVPEVWTVEEVAGGYAFGCTTAGKGKHIGFDNITAGSAAYRDKYVATEHGTFLIEDLNPTGGMSLVDSYVVKAPEVAYDLQGRRVNLHQGVAKRGVWCTKNQKYIK